MLWNVRHVTRYRYDRAVDLSTHMLHLVPRALPHQRVLSSRLHSQPAEVTWRHGTDHFGNHVDWLFLDSPHEVFEVTSEALVEVTPPALPAPLATQPWEAVVAAARNVPSAWREAEFLFDSPRIPVLNAAREYARASFLPGRPVLDAAFDLARRIRKEFAYRPGTTHVGTSIAQVLQGREGVCQDFAQVMISALRALGLPARYVSGYVRTIVPPGQVRPRGQDQSHAWVGCWLGPRDGWADLDPTNALLVADEHVVVGWGRDFSDVSPVQGIIQGGGDHLLEVEVDLDLADAVASAAASVEAPVREAVA